MVAETPALSGVHTVERCREPWIYAALRDQSVRSDAET